jgi:HlyD family secretion protein
MAVIRISETQTPELAFGQRVEVDTRNGKVKGHVRRIDPASTGGTVGVDVEIEDPLPPGARPDQSVDGTIELQRLADVLFVESPAVGQESTITLFKDIGNRCVRARCSSDAARCHASRIVEGLGRRPCRPLRP